MSNIMNGTVNMQETELVVLARDGNRSAFNELVNRNAERLYALCRSLAKNKGDTEDLLQDTFVKAISGIGKFKGESSFLTWLSRIAINLWLNKKKRESIVKFFSLSSFFEKNENEVKTAEFEDYRNTPDKDMELSVFCQNVQFCLDKLTREQKTVLILKYIEEKTIDEIAFIMNCSKGTVGSRLARGLKEFKKHMRYKNEMQQN